jgi:hypothetical protein
MGTTFRPGDPVRQTGSDLELVVEGYDDTGRVICSFRKGIARETAAVVEPELERIPLPPLPSA